MLQAQLEGSEQKDLAKQLTSFEKKANLSECQRSFIKKRIEAYQESDSLAEATRRIVRMVRRFWGVSY